MGKFWQTIQVKTIGEENLANKLVSTYAKYIFSVSEYWQGKFWQITHDSPNSPIFSPAKIFLCAVHIYKAVMT